MAPVKRNSENKGLPARWTLRHGAYYYRVPPGLESLWDGKAYFQLGKTLPVAYKAWSDRIGSTGTKSHTIGQLLDRYALEVVPTKSFRTQEGNQLALKKLRSVFGDMPLASITPQMIYQYVDKRSIKAKDDKGRLRGGKITAHREIEVLSHAFTKAVQWGYVNNHPFKLEVRLEGEKPRTRYVEDWEIVEALALPATKRKGGVEMVQAYIRLKLLTGMRRGDLLKLAMTDIRDDGIHVTPSKTKDSTGRSIIYQWTPALRASIDLAKSKRPVLSPFLFCNRMGKCYVNEKGFANGWDSLWQRFMVRVLLETKVTDRFTEHDIRAKCASDADTLEHAQAMLAHADSKTTDRIYRRKPEKVMPAK